MSYDLTLRLSVVTNGHATAEAVTGIVTALMAGETLRLDKYSRDLADKVPGTTYEYELREDIRRVRITVTADVEEHQHLQAAFDVVGEYLGFIAVKVRMILKDLALLAEVELNTL